LRTRLGRLRLSSESGGLRSIALAGRGAAGSADPFLRKCAAELSGYFRGRRRTFSVKLSPEGGTPFQRRVWSELAKIPYGETITYRELASRVRRPKAARAVGSACGRNPLMIVVPCHRVVAQDGGLGGYALGLRRKKWLLEHEKRASGRDRG